MYIKEQYIMHHMAYELVHHNDYEILHINEENNEIWLEKYSDRISNVVRLIHKGFDWQNELKADISNVFHKINTMGKLLLGKQVKIFNVYIATYPPVDSWEKLKSPIQGRSKKQMTMNMYYLAEENFQAELSRLLKDTGFTFNLLLANEESSLLEAKVHKYKLYLHNTLKDAREKVQSVFSFGKPFITYMLLLLNVIFFLVVELNGGSTDTENLIRFGAKYNPAIIDGEWWRIISAMFLHIGFPHIIMNMLALYFLGIAVERIYGSIRFLFIYLLAGIGGGIASFALTINVSAGASGAIFGLFGALLFFGLHNRRLFLQTMGQGVLFLIGFNLIFGFIAEQVDNSAHLGGLITGFIASAIVHLPKARQISKQIIAAIIYLFMIIVLTIFGLQSGKNLAMYHLDKIDSFLKNDHYEEVISHANKGLEKRSNKEFESQLYFQRSYAYIELDKYDLAIADLKTSINLLTKNSPNAASSHFNLALLYSEKGEDELAEKAIKQAYKLNPDNDDFVKLYKEITGEEP